MCAAKRNRYDVINGDAQRMWTFMFGAQSFITKRAFPLLLGAQLANLDF
jgi:hypothetical protein